MYGKDLSSGARHQYPWNAYRIEFATRAIRKRKLVMNAAVAKRRQTVGARVARVGAVCQYQNALWVPWVVGP